MSASEPGPVRRFFRGLGRFLDGTRRVVLGIVFWFVVLVVVVALVRGGPKPLADKTTLVLDLDGSVSEQRSGNLRGAALDQISGEVPRKAQLRDVLAVLDTAAKDDKITGLVLLLDDLEPTGLATLREIGAGVDRFRAAGKKVVAWGSSYDQRQYLVAIHADEVYLHPLGSVDVTGFGGVQNYYKDALDKIGVSVKVLKAGTFKDFGEPWTANEPSPAAVEAEKALLDSLWKTYTDEVEARRKLAPGSVMRSIDEAPQRLASVDGDRAKLALADKAVDGLKTRDELRALMVERGAPDEAHRTFRQVSWSDYLLRLRPKLTGDAIGVVVAEGEIVDGEQPVGSIGGVSTAALVRRAREDDAVKAVVLRVNSPGGSVFASELIRRELELTKAAGKPVVVSMGDTAASGGYWISTASDEIVADAGTVTGSIGVIALLPNAAGTLDKLGVHSTPLATTWLKSAYDPRVPLDPRLAEMIQRTVDKEYRDFVGRVAAARKASFEQIDSVAQGRVWSGTQAKERGLVDRLGNFRDALASAAKRAGLGDDPRVVYIEREPSTLTRFLAMLNGEIASIATNAIDGRLRSAGLPTAAVLPAAQDLRFIADLAARRRPFESVAHCLCTTTP